MYCSLHPLGHVRIRIILQPYSSSTDRTLLVYQIRRRPHFDVKLFGDDLHYFQYSARAIPS